MRRIYLLSAVLLCASAFAQQPAIPSKHELREWMTEALAAAEQVPVDDRRTLAMSMARKGSSPRVERIKAALFSIALRPQYYGAYSFVSAMQAPHDFSLPLEELRLQGAANRVLAEEFVEEIYGAHAGTESEEALNWLHGLAEFRLTVRRWDDALPVIRQVTEFDRDAYTLTLRAVIEKMNGDDQAYAEISANCPPSTYGDDFCITVARSLVNRTQWLGRPDPLPSKMEEILTGKATPREDWKDRLHGLFMLHRTNPTLAASELQQVLANDDAPEWAHDDAIFLLAGIADHNRESEGVIALTDCWMSRLGIQFPEMTQDVWQALIMDERDPSNAAVTYKAGGEDCMNHTERARQTFALDSPCMFELLQTRLLAASKLRNRPLIQQTIERTASIVATTGKGVRALAQFMFIGAKGLRSNTRKSERHDAALQYLSLLRDAETAVPADEVNEAVRLQTARVSQPWASPTIVPAVPCPGQ